MSRVKAERRGILWRWRGPSGLRWVWRNGRGPHLEGRQEPQASSAFRTPTAGSLQSWDRRVRPRLVWRNGTPLDSRVVHRITGHLSSCVWNLRFYPDDAWGCQFPFVFCLHTQGCLRRGIQPSDSYQEQTRKSVSFGMWHHPQAYVSNFFLRRTST